ncbi:MAG: ExeA family protein [Nitrospiraceae bacterium]
MLRRVPRTHQDRTQTATATLVLRSALIGVILGCAVATWLAVELVPTPDLGLWTKYQVARAFATIPGLEQSPFTWAAKDGRGETLTTAQQLAESPTLRPWAAAVSESVRMASWFAVATGFWTAISVLLVGFIRTVPKRPSGRASIATPDKESSPRNIVMDRDPAVGQGDAAEACEAVTQPTTSSPSFSSSPPSPSLATEPPAQAASEHQEPPSGTPLEHLTQLTPAKLQAHYASYWGLQELPFENTPDPKFYFPSAKHEEALHRLLYGVTTRKGAVMLTGEIGCGKSLLSRTLIQHLSSQQYDTALITNPAFAKVEELFREVAYQLGIEASGTKADMLHCLNDRLLANHQRGLDTVLIIDEAQTLRDDMIFEEIRLLLNFQLNERFLLTLVLIGQPDLKDRVTGISQLAQRIPIRYHLAPFTEDELEQYILFRLKTAGCDHDLFTKDALQLAFDQTRGIPRRINSLCDLCLLIGRMENSKVIDPSIVKRASDELT